MARTTNNRVEKKRRWPSPCAAPERKIRWLRTTLAVALLGCFGLSWHLWISARLFPLAPVSDALPKIFHPLDSVLFFAMLGLLAVGAFVRHAKYWLAGFVVLAAGLALFDQNRWQPWFYQCVCMIAVLARYEASDSRIALNGCRLIVISTYFYGGLQKLNANFIHQTWPDVAGALVRVMPVIARVGIVVPLVEMAIAIGLMTRKFRNAAVVLAIATHVAILGMLVASSENRVVWPWNVAMVAFVIILFWQEEVTGVGELVARNAGQMAVMLLFGILPALSFFGWWDEYLSSALYSGNTRQAVIYATPAAVEQLPAEVRPHIWQESQPYFLDLNRWSYGALNVPLVPEPRVYREVMRGVCELAGPARGDLRLRINGKPDVFSGERDHEFYDCGHLDAIP